VNATIPVAIIFAVLLVLEWRYRLRSMRLAAVALALLLFLFAQPGYTRAARRALMMPPAERVTQIRGSPLSDYVSGVRTMEQAVGDDSNMGANARMLSVGVLVWLACSPVLRRARRPSMAEVSGRQLGNEDE
jgi:hypothetical protein